MPIADDSALCRLLCAAEASYGIQPGRPFAQVDPWYHQVGFIGAPTVVEAGPAEIDAALVGRSGDGIIVAFRGTLPPKVPLTVSILLDWLQDFIAIPKAFSGFPGKIHLGFHEAIETLWPGVHKAVEALRTAHPDAPILVTGHSKGGSLAALGAWLLQSHGLAPAKVVTFAGAHVGDGAFAAAYNAKVTQWRYENYLAKAHSLVRYPLGYCRAVCDSGLCAGEAPK